MQGLGVRVRKKGVFTRRNPPFRFFILWLGVATKFTLLWCDFEAEARRGPRADLPGGKYHKTAKKKPFRKKINHGTKCEKNSNWAIAVDLLKFIFWDIGCQIVGYNGRKFQIVGYTGRKYNRSKSGWYSRHNLNSVFC